MKQHMWVLRDLSNGDGAALIGLAVSGVFDVCHDIVASKVAATATPRPHTFAHTFRYFNDPATGLCFASVVEQEEWDSASEGFGGRTVRSIVLVPCGEHK